MLSKAIFQIKGEHKFLFLFQDLQDFLDSGSEHGVILFTMGFIFQPNAVPTSQIQAIFDAFSQLPQKVIMKLDDISDKPDLIVPKNVLLKPFLPQQDILAHKNLRLFITHCGMHGVMEAMYHAVPMVGIPIFIDQVSWIISYISYIYRGLFLSLKNP